MTLRPEFGARAIVWCLCFYTSMVAKGNVTRVEAGFTYVTCGRGFDPVTYSSPRGRINRRSRSQPQRNREEPKRRETRESLSWSVFFFQLLLLFFIAHSRDRRQCLICSHWPVWSADLVIIITVVIVMGKVTGKHLLCFLLLSVALCWAEDSTKDVRKADNDTGEVTTSIISSGKTAFTLFCECKDARRGFESFLR